MDPISAIGLLASLSNLIGASKEVISLIRSFRDGDKELSGLYGSVSLFEENLKGFDRVLRSRRTNHKISVETINTAIKESGGLMKELEIRLSSILKSESSTVRRMRWVQHKSTFERINEDLKGKCMMLHSLVSVAQMEMMLSMCGDNPHLQDICTNVADEMSMEPLSGETTPYIGRMSSSSTSIPTRDNPSGDTHAIMDQSADILSCEESFTTLPPDSALSVSRSHLKPGPWSPQGSLTAQSESEASTRRLSDSTINSMAVSLGCSSISGNSSMFDSISIASTASSVPQELEFSMIAPESSQESDLGRIALDSTLIRRACRYDCFCDCHTQSTLMSEYILQKVDGPLFGKGTAPGSKVECSEPDCASAIASQRRANLSAAFFRRAMSRLSSAQSIKMNVLLNTYRMVPEGSDAMRYAKQGNLEKLKLSLKLGETTLWDTAPDGWSLLHTAVYARQLPMVKYLCERGADTNAADLGARKPVDLAILKSLTVEATKVEKEIVQVLSNQDDFLIDFEFSPIQIAVLDLYDPSDSERPSLEKLIDFVDEANNAEPCADWARWKAKYKKRSPLFLAIIEQFRASAVENPNTPKVIHNLLDQKDRKLHWTPLHWAASTGRADKMKTLTHAGADPFIMSNLNSNIIHAAVESNALKSLAYALKISKDHPTRLNIDFPNVWGESPLIMAAQGCLTECVRQLLEAGADKNVRQENQQVALHYAGLSKRGAARRKTVSLLCAGSANESNDSSSSTSSTHINAQDEDGRPPIFNFLDDSKCIECLIAHGARLDLRDKSGKNIFHHACIQDDSEQLILLLRLCPTSAHDALAKEKDDEGNTPLLEALRYDSISCAQTLLTFPEVDVGDMSGSEGWCAAHYAARIGDPELLELVLRHRGFVKGVKTDEGKTFEVVAMESGNWCGRVKDLLRTYNNSIA